MPELDIVESEALAVKVMAQPRMCFMNACRALRILSRQGREVVYVEGYAATPREVTFPVEHAWIECGDQILDPTWALLGSPALLGLSLAGTVYVPTSHCWRSSPIPGSRSGARLPSTTRLRMTMTKAAWASRSTRRSGAD